MDSMSFNNLEENAQYIVSNTLHFAESIMQKYESELLSLVIFGSVASGEANEKSDIDILIIIKEPSQKEKLTEIKTNMINKEHIRFENINIITMSDKEFEKGYLIADDFIISILSNNIIIKDDGFLKTFMQRELFLPSRKIISERAQQLEDHSLLLLQMMESTTDQILKDEFYTHLLMEARLKLLKKKMPVPITKKDVIDNIRKIDKKIYEEMVNIDKGDIRKRVMAYVSS
jgi:predicted nucleotidyltransferase